MKWEWQATNGRWVQNEKLVYISEKLEERNQLRYEVVHEKIIVKRILNTQINVDSTELA
jgi:hypothetical protein